MIEDREAVNVTVLPRIHELAITMVALEITVYPVRTLRPEDLVNK